MRIIAFSDLHVHDYQLHNEDGGRLWECFDVLERVAEEAEKREADCIVFGGDMTEEPKHLDTRIIDPLIHKAERLAEAAPVYYITGNHDHREKDITKVGEGIYHSTTDIFKPFFDITCADFKMHNIASTIRLYGIPFLRNKERLQKELDALLDYTEQNPEMKVVLVMHNYPDYIAEDNPHVKWDFDTSHEVFDKVAITLCGHYHVPMMKRDGRFVVMGNPIHRRTTDVDQEKYIYCIDIDRKDGSVKVETIRTDHLGRRFCRGMDTRKTRPDIDLRYEEKDPGIEKAGGTTKKWRQSIEEQDYETMIGDFGKKENLEDEYIKAGLNIVTQ